jgi:hypothetical protein
VVARGAVIVPRGGKITSCDNTLGEWRYLLKIEVRSVIVERVIGLLLKLG